MKINTHNKLAATFPLIEFMGNVVEVNEKAITISAYQDDLRAVGGTGQVPLEMLLGEQTMQAWKLLSDCFPVGLLVTGSAFLADGKLYLVTLENA